MDNELLLNVIVLQKKLERASKKLNEIIIEIQSVEDLKKRIKAIIDEGK